MHFCNHVKIFVLLTSSLFILKIANAKPYPDEDDYLDELLKEFKEAGNQALQGKKPEDNFIPLNAQSKYLKHDNCSCTKFYLCDVGDKRQKIQHGNGEESIEEDEGADVDLINIRLNVPEGACPHYLEICCEKFKETPTVSKTMNKACGKRNDRGVGFRITGTMNSESQFGEFPWMTAITETKMSSGGKVRKAFVCGASLIHPQVVLTAAHCLRNKTANTLQVRVGEWDTVTTSELYPHEESDVDQIIMHPLFQMKRNLLNDIALLILSKEVQLAPNVSPICLPPSEIKFDSKQRCFATGWGKDDFGAQGVYHTILKKVDLPIIPRNECQNRLRETKLGNRFHLHESFVCAGGEPGKDTCKGDGGSPLVCQFPGSNYYVQYGIVSWGLGCGGTTPAAYVNVPHFAPWIEETLETLGLTGDKYGYSEPR